MLVIVKNLFIMAGVDTDFPPNFDDHILALEGISLMLNNGFKESEALFNKFKNNSPLMSAGSSFVSFMQGLMTFEEEKLEKAITALKSTQKLCNSAEEDLIDNLKNKFRKKTSQKKPLPIEDLLLRRIIVADCYLYISLIYFIKQEVTGGWNLRKAWKLYEKCYQQITTMLKSHHVDYSTPSSNSPIGFDPGPEERDRINSSDMKTSSSLSSVSSSNNVKTSSETERPSLPNGEMAGFTESIESVKALPITEKDSKSIHKSTLLRLYGSVCFGYGAFNLCVSLVPQNLLRIVNMMGFCGDRITGIKALEVACQSEDMKAPLAMLSLLWYHTVVRSFFAVDGDSVDAGLSEAEELLQRNEAKYPTSSLVLFFKGRVLRGKCNIESALDSLQQSYDQAKEQRELQLLCAYEIGWCCIMQLDWQRALENMTRLKEESKWSVCYYCYLTALLNGVMNNFEKCQTLMREVPKLMKRKTNQLEIYVVRKAKIFEKIPSTYEHILLLILEVLYLWRAFPNCTPESLRKMLTECEKVSNPCLNGMKQLILGALHKCLGHQEKCKEYFRNAIQISERDVEDGHIAPFACYELSILLLASEGTKQKGGELLHHCKDNFSGYDFENRLQMRIHATELRLKEER
ncbi:unnamed protein product [Clavelina lepadiformis]|uniref:Tetratricopeptide repeat protein 39C n=1 Tax=Clavelina lepadiformis TaxID=159417 RepID=A0ABP0FZG2_CLALP